MNYVMNSSPHAHDSSSVSRIMYTVCLALVPCTLWGIYLFGYPALMVIILTIGSGLICEYFCLHLSKQNKNRIWDGSALLTCWLLAICLPPWSPWWICVGGSTFAIIIGKQIYGGLGCNVFNPAMLARTALLISFPLQMTTWPQANLSSDLSLDFISSLQMFFLGGTPVDGLTGATTLSNLKTQLTTGAQANSVETAIFSTSASFMGITGGSFGETSGLLVLLGGLFLISRRIISWHIPLSMLISISLFALIMNASDPERYASVSYHVFSGGLLLGAFFIATDPTTSPSSPLGQIVFGASCGVLVYIIRVWSGFPEGVAFAVLFMNTLSPLIDMYCRPRIYGRKYNGAPLNYKRNEGHE